MSTTIKNLFVFMIIGIKICYKKCCVYLLIGSLVLYTFWFNKKIFERSKVSKKALLIIYSGFILRQLGFIAAFVIKSDYYINKKS